MNGYSSVSVGGAGPFCVEFVYKIVEITTASSNNGGGRVVGLLCMGRNRAGSNLAVHFEPFSLSNFSKR